MKVEVISKETRGAVRGEANRPTLALALDALSLLNSRDTAAMKTLCGLLLVTGQGLLLLLSHPPRTLADDEHRGAGISMRLVSELMLK